MKPRIRIFFIGGLVKMQSTGIVNEKPITCLHYLNKKRQSSGLGCKIFYDKLNAYWKNREAVYSPNKEFLYHRKKINN